MKTVEEKPGLLTELHAARGVLGKCRRQAEEEVQLMVACHLVRAQLAMTEAIHETEKAYDQKIPGSN